MAAVVALLAVADAVHHLALRVRGFLVEAERAAWVHDAIVVAEADQHRAFDVVGASFEGEVADLAPCILEVAGPEEPANPLLDRRVIVEEIVAEIEGATPDGDGLDPLVDRGATRSAVPTHAGSVNP